MTEIQQPHFWPILEALPYPVVYKDLVSPSIFANNAAQRLFNLSPENATAMVSMAALKAAAICNTNTQQPYSLFNNPLIQALSGNEISQHVLVAKQAASYHMHSRLISLPFTLHQSVIISF